MSDSGTRISPWNSLVDGRLTFDLTTQDLVLDQLTKENARLRKELAEGGGGTKEEIEALEKEIQDLRNRNNSLIIQLTMSEQSNQSLTTENTRLSEAKEKLEKENEILRSYISDGGKTVIELYNTALQEIEQLNNNVKQQQETIDQLNADINSWKSTTGYDDLYGIQTAKNSINSVIDDTLETGNLNNYITSIVNWGTGINSAYSMNAKASETKIRKVVNDVLSTIGDSTSNATLDILNERVQAYVDNQAKYEAELNEVYSIIGQKDVQGLLNSYKEDLETNTGTKSDYTTFVGFENDYVKALQAYSQLISYAKGAIALIDGDTEADATAIQTKASSVLQKFNAQLTKWSITSTTIDGLILPIVNELNKGTSSESTVTALQNTIVGYYQITHDSTANSYDSSMDEPIKDLLKKVRDDIRLNFVSKYNSEELPSKVSADDVINYYFKTSGEDLSSVFLRTRDKCQDYYKDDLDAANTSLKKEKDDRQADLNTIYKKCSGDDKDNATRSEIEKSISDLVTIVGTAIDTADKQDKIWEGTTVPTTTNLVDCGAAVTLMRTNYHNKVVTYDSSESSLQDIVTSSMNTVGVTDMNQLVSTLEQIRKDLYGLYNGSIEGFTSINDVTDSMSTSIENIKDLVGGNTAKNLESIIENLTNLLDETENPDKPSVNKTLGKLSGLYDSNTYTSFKPLLTNMSETISTMNTTIGSGGLSRIDEIKNSLDGVLSDLNVLAQLPTEQEKAKENITAAVTAVDSRLTTLGNDLTKANTRADTAEDKYADTKAQYDELAAVTGNYTVVQTCLTTLYSLYDKSMVVTWPTTENPTPSYTLSDIKTKFSTELPNLWTLTDATKQETEETKQDLVTLINNLTKLVGKDKSLDDLLGNIRTFYDTSSLKAPTLTNAITAISIYCNQINDLCKLSSSIDTSYIDTSYTNLSNVKTNLGTMLTLNEQTTYSTIPDRVTYITTNVGGAVSTILASIKEKTGDETSTTINAAVTNIESTGDYRIYLQEIAGLPDVTDIYDLILTIGPAVIKIVKAVTGEEHGYPGEMNISGLAANVESAASKLESVTGLNYIYKGATDGSAYEINWAFDATNKSGIQTYYADCKTITNLTGDLSNTRAYLQAIHGNTDSTLIDTLVNEINTIIGNIADDSLKKLLDDLNEKTSGHESTLRGAVNQVGSGQTDDDRKRLNMLIDGTEDSCITMDAAITKADELIGEIKDKVYAPDKTLESINDVAGSTGITGTQIATIYSSLISSDTWDITYDGATRTIDKANRNTEILIKDIEAIAKYIAKIVEPNMNGNFQTIYDEINNKLRAQTDEGLAKMMGCESFKIPVAVENSTLNTLTQCVTEIIGESDLGSLRQKLYMAATKHPTEDGHKYTTMTELISSIYGTYIENAILTYLNNLSGDEAGSILDSIKNIYRHAKNINRLVYGQNESSEELTVEKSMKDVETDLGTYIDNIFANGGWTDNHDVAMIDTNIQSLHDDLSNVVYGNTLHTIDESMTQINVIGVSSLNDNLAKLQALYGSTGTDAATYTYTSNGNAYTLTWPTSTTDGRSDDPEETDVPEAVSDLTKVVNQIVEDVKLINDALTSDNQTKLSTAAANILTYRDQLAYLLESDSTLTAPPYPFSTKTISGSAGQLRDDTSAIWETIGAVNGYKACLDDAAGYLPDLRNYMATIVDGSDGSTLDSIRYVLSGIEVTLKGLAGKDNIYDDVGVISNEWDTLKAIIGNKSLSSTLQSSLNAMIQQIDGTTANTTVSAVKTALNTAWTKYKELVSGDKHGYLYKSEPSDETLDFYLLIQTKMTDESAAVNELKDLIGGDSSWNPTTIDALHKQLISEVNGLSLCIVGDQLYDEYGNPLEGDHNGYASVYAAWQALKSIVGVELSDNLTKECSKLANILIDGEGIPSLSGLITKCQNDVNTIYELYYQNIPGDKKMKNIYDDLNSFIENMKPLININPAITIKDIYTCHTQLKSDLSTIYTGQTSGSDSPSTSDIKDMLDEITTAITAQTDGTYASELARYQTLVGTE